MVAGEQIRSGKEPTGLLLGPGAEDSLALSAPVAAGLKDP